MIKPETNAKIDAIIAKLDEADGMFVQGMANEIERLQAKIVRLNERASELSWDRSGGDRMGGGWTDAEINRSRNGGW